MVEFNDLTTVQFQRKMRPAAIAIYQKVFPGCHIEDLREQGTKVHVLDKEFAIDALVYLPSGQWISLQEKYRDNGAMKYLDFTQEFLNAHGTKNETPGEWFKLGAQLYFYGWANSAETDFEKWLLMDVVKYKMLIEDLGGIEKVGTLRHNKKHGKASFYAIPIKRLSACFVADYRQYKQNE